MTVLLSSCFMSYAQSDSAVVSIEALKTANAKMIELQYEKEINTNLKNIIKNDSIINYELKELCNEYYNTTLKFENMYQKDTKKLKKQRNILGSTSVGLLIITIILLI